MNSSNYADANHETQSCNLTHLIYGWQPSHRHQYPPPLFVALSYCIGCCNSEMFLTANPFWKLGTWQWHRLNAAIQPWVYDYFHNINYKNLSWYSLTTFWSYTHCFNTQTWRMLSKKKKKARFQIRQHLGLKSSWQAKELKWSSGYVKGSMMWNQ